MTDRGTVSKDTILDAVSIALHIRDCRDDILRVAARHGAANICLFGSVARGEDTPHSDVDLLVDVTGATSPWFPGSMVADLEQLLGRRVQVVIRRSLSPLIRESVLREAVPLRDLNARTSSTFSNVFVELQKILHTAGNLYLFRARFRTQSFAIYRFCASQPNGSTMHTNCSTPKSTGDRLPACATS